MFSEIQHNYPTWNRRNNSNPIPRLLHSLQARSLFLYPTVYPYLPLDLLMLRMSVFLCTRGECASDRPGGYGITYKVALHLGTSTHTVKHALLQPSPYYTFLKTSFRFHLASEYSGYFPLFTFLTCYE